MLAAQVARVRSLERQLGWVVAELFVHVRGKAPGLIGTPIRDFRRPGGLRAGGPVSPGVSGTTSVARLCGTW